MQETDQNDVITPEEFFERMKAIANAPNYDEESAHGSADWLMMQTLTSLGYGAGVEVFDKMPVWYA